MRILRYLIYGRSPRTAVIKQKAHLFTLLSAAWLAFTGLGVFLFSRGPSTDHWLDVTVAILLWLLHASFIVLAIYFWFTEKPKPVLMIDRQGGGI